MTDSHDGALLTRLRDLGLVELDALLSGTSGDAYLALLAAHADELTDALSQARARMAALVRAVAAGDPLTVLDVGPAARAKDGGRDASERLRRQLADRAQAARALARLDDGVARVYQRLVEADRRRAGG